MTRVALLYHHGEHLEMVALSHFMAMESMSVFHADVLP